MKLSRLMFRTSVSLGMASLFAAMVWSSAVAQPTAVTPVNYKIALIGDQALGSNARAVLTLIQAEGADAVVHLGDFDYTDNPAAWDAQINDILGEDFPYFACVGNHDAARFYGAGGYQEFMEARMNRLGVPWDGDLGVQSSLTYNGIFFVLTGPGVFGSGHSTYVRDQLAQDSSIWSISGWHKNMQAMQVGGKTDETGWGVYEESRKGDAIIATGHEHSYSRTHHLSSCEFQTVAGTSSPLILTKDLPGTGFDEDRTFAFVTGLGGASIRNQQLSGAWWASIYTSNQGANYGALFGTFNVNGDPKLATFYFKDIDGTIPDSFTVVSNVEDVTVAVDPDDGIMPVDFALNQNYPNPFNPQTEIRFQLAAHSQVELTVFNTLGQEVCTLIDAAYEAGSHSVRWSGTDDNSRPVASGVYFYRLKAGTLTQVKKMILLR